MRRLIAIFVAFIFSAAAVHAAVIHVPADQPTVQAGIDAAVDGDTVLIAPGIYQESGLRFHGKLLVIASNYIYDSLEYTVESTIIDGNNGGSIFIISGGHIGQTITGLSLINGTGSVTESPPIPYGGAVLVSGSGPIISSNIMRNNNVNGHGGAIWIEAGHAVITGNVFRNNSSLKGGAIHIKGSDSSIIMNNTFISNQADSGGAIFGWVGPASEILNCQIDSNSAIYAGGGVCLTLDAKMRFDSCGFYNNSSEWNGGGLYLINASSSSIHNSAFVANRSRQGGGIYFNSSWSNIVGCTFIRDTGTFSGGAIYCNGSSPSIISCDFSGNVAQEGGSLSCEYSSPIIEGSSILNGHSNEGGGVWCRTDCNPRITNCTISNNSATSVGGGIALISGCTLEMSNSIISYSPSGEAIYCQASLATIACSDIYNNMGGDWVGCIADQSNLWGNISADPQFCDTPSADYHIRNSSPCAPANNSCGTLIGAYGIGCNSLPPTVPIPLQPKNNAVLAITLPTLYLSNSSDPEGGTVQYDFEVYDDTLSGTPFAAGEDIAEQPDSTGWQVNVALIENARYFWRARSSDSYEYSDWTGFESFWVNAIEEFPVAFGISYPPDTNWSQVYDFPVYFWWGGAPDPDPFDSIYFNLYVATDPDFVFMATYDSIYATLYYAPLNYSTHYWWKVAAVDTKGNATYSTNTADFMTWVLGDVNHDLAANIGDVIFLINLIFHDGYLPYPFRTGDINGDCCVNIGDVVYMLNYIFTYGEAPRVGCDGCE